MLILKTLFLLCYLIESVTIEYTQVNIPSFYHLSISTPFIFMKATFLNNCILKIYFQSPSIHEVIFKQTFTYKLFIIELNLSVIHLSYLLISWFCLTILWMEVNIDSLFHSLIENDLGIWVNELFMLHTILYQVHLGLTICLHIEKWTACNTDGFPRLILLYNTSILCVEDVTFPISYYIV